MSLRGLTALALALVLALRVVAVPFIMTSSDPNLMAICSGGQIIYISIKDGQPVEDGEGPAAESCPFFGVTSVLAGGDAPVVTPVPLSVVSVQVALVLALPPGAPTYDNQSRAPPVLS